MTKDTKNVTVIKSQTAINDSDIKTDKTEPTMSDALNKALNSHSYFSDIMSYMTANKMTIIEMVNIIDDNKKTHAYKHSIDYKSYGQSPISNIKIYNRLTGGFKHYSHLLKTDVKHKIDIKNKDGQTIKTTTEINEACFLVDFKPLA